MTDWNRHFSAIKQKGDRKVQTWTHPRSGLSADIFLRGTSFVALFLEEMFEAPDVAMLRKKLSDKAEHWIEMKWYPMLQVEIQAETHRYRGDLPKEGVEFGYKRFFLSQSPTGEIFSVDWDVDPEHRKAQMESWGGGYRNYESYARKIKLAGLPLNAPLKKSDDEWLMDYSEELWQGFRQINKGIHDLRRRLREIVGTKQGLQQLLKARDGSQLLLKQ